MAKKAIYARLAQSREFDQQAKAIEWADQKKKDYTQQGVSVRKEIDFMQSTGRWSAKIFVKATGGNSVERPAKPTGT